MDIFTLDMKGALLAVVMALLMLTFGGFGYYGPTFVAVMIFFLILSWIVTRLGRRYKQKEKLYQKTRTVKNVLANGLGPLIFAFVYLVTSHSLAISWVFLFGFLASAASVTADKFNSEIGVLNGDPTSIVTFKKLKKGTSGGVTVLGLAAGIVGALLISALGVQLLGIYHPICDLLPMNVNCNYVGWVNFITELAIVTFGGFVGSIVDSYLGHFEEKGIGSKYTTNFICSIAGGITAILVFLL